MSIINLYGESGTRYQFKLHNINDYFQDRPGVYIFCKQTSVDSYDIIYIGETHSFFERIYKNLEHHNAYRCISLHKATHIAILPFYGHEKQRVRIETDLRHLYSATPCNLQ